MVNMGYVKWENTAAAMQQCLAEGEGELDDGEQFKEMNEYERTGLIACLRAAAEMLEAADIRLLEEAEIDFSRFANL